MTTLAYPDATWAYKQLVWAKMIIVFYSKRDTQSPVYYVIYLYTAEKQMPAFREAL